MAMDETYVAVTADIVGSREITRSERGRVQSRLLEAVEDVNGQFEDLLVAPFGVERGDAFQGLLSTAVEIPVIMWTLELQLGEVDLRWGIGRGAVIAPEREAGSWTAVVLDGPAFHAAREAIEEASRRHRLGGIFRGFGARPDAALSGLSQLLWAHRQGWTATQREAVVAIWRGESKDAVSSRLGITRASLNRRLATAGWDIFMSGLESYRAVAAMIEA